jgi:hypothetical protein
MDKEMSKFMHAIYNARKRARIKGLECELSADTAKELWWRCGGKCELTGIQFDYEDADDSFRRPYIPSIDRIDSNKGYTLENVRVVCSAVNIAMNQWGEDVLFTIAAGIAKDRGRWRKGINMLPKGVKVASINKDGPAYIGRVTIDGKRVHTKTFRTPDEASDAIKALLSSRESPRANTEKVKITH